MMWSQILGGFLHLVPSAENYVLVTFQHCQTEPQTAPAESKRSRCCTWEFHRLRRTIRMEQKHQVGEDPGEIECGGR